MANETIGLLGLISLLLMILVHVPIGVAMGISGVVTFGILRNFSAAFSVVGSEATSALASTDLALIPLFILMGNFASISGMSRDLYGAAYSWFGHWRGGLASATIAACAGF